jgi:hypothetical protein
MPKYAYSKYDLANDPGCVSSLRFIALQVYLELRMEHSGYLMIATILIAYQVISISKFDPALRPANFVGRKRVWRTVTINKLIKN